MKKILSFFSLALLAGCCCDPARQEFQTQYRKLWNEKISVAERAKIEDSILAAAQKMPSGDDFIFYTHERMLPGEVEAYRDKYAILDFYEEAFERVLSGVRNDKVEPGKLNFYYLYNMGFVVKTPTATFGVDLCHRRAAELVPYLDFAVVTHNHEDHTSWHFLQAMNKAKKQVYSNFWSCSAAKLQFDPGYSKEPFREIVMPSVTLRTYESDHLNYKWYKFNMPVEIVCQSGDKEFVLFSGGDSCDTMQWQCKKAPDLAIMHPRVGGDIVHGAMLIDAKLTLVAHLLEMQHSPASRWPFAVGYNEQKLLLLNHKLGAVPHWGDKIVLPISENEIGNHNLHIPALPAKKPVRIMPVGDSITRGNFIGENNHHADVNGGGYRLPLQKMLKAENFSYQFVGELGYWAYGSLGECDPDFQRYHHGLSGFGNRAIRRGMALPPSDMRKISRPEKPIKVPGIVDSLRRWSPDVILLMSGANGFMPAERDLLIQTIAENFTGVLFVATIPPQCAPRPGFENVDAYNASLKDGIAKIKDPKCKIYFVDMNSALTTDDLLPDGVHPKKSGEEKIAKRWFETLMKHRQEIEK